VIIVLCCDTQIFQALEQSIRCGIDQHLIYSISWVINSLVVFDN
jgi:hypothetical protein